jgi:hypothetical protein
MTTVDHCTKWGKGVSIPGQSTSTITGAIVTKIFSLHGVPQMPLFDQGQNLTSDFIKEVCSILRVVKPSTRPYNLNVMDKLKMFTLHTLPCSLEGNGQDLELYVDCVPWLYSLQPDSITNL